MSEKPTVQLADAGPEEQAIAKHILADAIRMLERGGHIDYSGHGSIRRSDTTFYINSGASVRGAMTIDDVVAVDFDGNLVEGTAKPPLEFYLHAEVFRARPDVRAILHMHPHWSTFLTMTGVPFRPVYAQATVLGDNVPVLDSPLSINSRPMGEQVAATLDQHPAALLKSHGAVVVGTTMLECFAKAIYLEENAYRQYMAMQIGEPYVFSEDEQRECRAKQHSASLYRKVWEYYRLKLG